MTVFSPQITPAIYNRGQEGYGDEITRMVYDEWVLLMSQVPDADDVCEFGDGMVMHRHDIGDVYIGDGHAHVSDSMYRSHPVVFLQEHVASMLMRCKRKGVVSDVRCTDERCVYRDS